MAEWHPVAQATEIEEGFPRCVHVGEARIGLYRLGEEVFALNDICTHAYAHLTEGYIDGEAIECPLHQACFSIRTGKVLNLPATVDLKTYPVEVREGTVHVEV